MPESFAQSSDGLLFAANGIDPALQWDGVTPEFYLAGLEAPKTAVTLSAAGSGTIKGTYFAYVRFIDNRGNASNLSPLSNQLTVDNVGKFIYSNVEVPQDPKVVRKQILRNTTGQARVVYVDVDTANLTATTFESSRSDSLLQVETAVVLLTPNNLPVANMNEPPPSDRAYIAAHLDRMFLAGEQIYEHGAVELTFGSKTVRGIQTEWPATLAKRFLYVADGEQVYEIDSVDTSAQTLTLVEAYTGTTRAYARYAIRPSVGARKLVYFSEAGKPQSWSPFSSISIQEDQDEITGLMPKGSYLYILEKRHAYRLTYQRSPEEDGFVFLALGRGCINNRCWLRVGDIAYLLDESGVYSFDGGQQVQDLSGPIQDLFESTRHKVDSIYRIQWSASRWFHACYDPGHRVARWFVTLAGKKYPRHAICYDINDSRWWVEEYPVPIAASTSGVHQGEQRVFLGGPGGKVYLLGGSSLDGVAAESGTIRGTVTSATQITLTDNQATFPSSLNHSTVSIVSGRGKGQQRRISESTTTTLTVDRPWLIRPDNTSTYQVGGVRWRYRTGWFRLLPLDRENPRRVEVQFEPLSSPCIMDARLYIDRHKSPKIWDYTLSNSSADGFASTRGEGELVADLTKPSGFVQKRMDGQKDIHLDGDRLISWELSGVSNRDAVVIYQIVLDGVTN